MDLQLLESLLYQEESEALDFKVEEYPFEGATDEQKGELLKDILAFANAWRQSDAHILIGVEEVRAGRSLVRGLKPERHLLNRNLQQFVQSKTNRPVEFSYAPVKFEGAEIGVLTIPLQDRPVYLVRAYGRLEPQVVYIRRGDTTGVAGPDEIARMGSSAVLARVQPVLELDFANLNTRQRFGTSIEVESRRVELPAPEQIPLYGPPPKSAYGIMVDPMDNFQNREYYREFACHIRDNALLCPIGIAVSNPSVTVAEEVVVTLELDAAAGLLLLDEGNAPVPPSTDRLPVLRSAASHKEPRVTVTRYCDLIEVKARIGTVRPGTTRYSTEPFYVGAPQAMDLTARISLSANNLPKPITVTAEIRVNVSPIRIKVEDIIGPARHEQST